MTIDDMIPGNRYWVSDGYGYEHIWYIGVPSEEEIKERWPDAEQGYYVKIKYEISGKEDIWYESEEYLGSLIYVEEAYD